MTFFSASVLKGFVRMPSCGNIAEIYNNYVDDMYTYAIYLGFKEYDIIDAIQDVFVNLCELNRDIKKRSQT